jgi:hypothetical protein
MCRNHPGISPWVSNNAMHLSRYIKWWNVSIHWNTLTSWSHRGKYSFKTVIVPFVIRVYRYSVVICQLNTENQNCVIQTSDIGTGQATFLWINSVTNVNFLEIYCIYQRYISSIVSAIVQMGEYFRIMVNLVHSFTDMSPGTQPYRHVTWYTV